MNLTKKIFAYIKITRPINVIITFLVVVVAILISEKEQTELITILLASLAAALTAAAGNIINDIYDVETDRFLIQKSFGFMELLQKKKPGLSTYILNFIAALYSDIIIYRYF